MGWGSSSGRAALFAVALAFGSPADAGWEYAQWGMSPEEVVQASAGAARPTAQEPPARILDQDLLATAPYRMGEVALQAEFLFSPADRRLAMVRLTADPDVCGTVMFDLMERLHRADRYHEGARTGIVGMEWFSVPRNNHIIFSNDLRRPGRCEILYRPIRGTGSRRPQG